MISVIALVVLSVLVAFIFKKFGGSSKKNVLDYRADVGGKQDLKETESFLTEKYCEECNSIIKKESKSCSTCGKHV